ncbi:MAG: phosphatidate cytidylyltransferase [Blastocatellia bacterium]|nr:phosphatidate cytidylyltransferase [Blastocatellia bacterium]
MKRVLSGVILLSLLGLSIWISSPIFFIAFGILTTSIALREYYKLVSMIGFDCYQVPAYAVSGIIFYAFASNRHELILPASFGLLLGIMFLSLIRNRRGGDFQKVVGSSAATLFGVFYIIFLAGHLIGVRVMAQGTRAGQLLSIFFLIIAAGDAGAYYIGKNFGRHKLAPNISPGKTVEGSVGGILGAVLAALVSKYSFYPEIPLADAILLAVVMNIIGQMGDLFESMIKRGVGAKDAASIIPGHGGLLDRLDSVLFNAPILYYYFLFSK